MVRKGFVCVRARDDAACGAVCVTQSQWVHELYVYIVQGVIREVEPQIISFMVTWSVINVLNVVFQNIRLSSVVGVALESFWKQLHVIVNCCCN